MSADLARVSVVVEVPPEVAFRVFTEDIDRWWRRGLAYRVAGRARGIVHLEPHVGGALYESFDGPDGPTIVPTGRITAWEPPDRLAFDWRSVTFAPAETTAVEVRFEAHASARGPATRVIVTHAGWDAIRPDHPVRHGLASGPFLAMIGRWWGDLLSSLRESTSPPRPF
ncbi:MAG: SRPBCC domain-containing protein [Myxococcota bacterium]